MNTLRIQWYSQNARLYIIRLSRPSAQFNRSSIGRLAISKSFCTVITLRLFFSLFHTHTESNPYFSVLKSITLFSVPAVILFLFCFSETHTQSHTRFNLYPHRLWVNMYTAHSLLLHQSIFFSFLHLCFSLPKPHLSLCERTQPSGVPCHYGKIPFDNDFPGSKKKIEAIRKRSRWL